jgi:hypothetical protein
MYLDGKPHIVVFFAFMALQHFTVFYSILHVGALMSPFLWSNPLEVVSKPHLRSNGRVAPLTRDSHLILYSKVQHSLR